MRWIGRRQSTNVEDRRGGGGRNIAIGGGAGTIVIVIIVWLLGGDPGSVINAIQPGTEQASDYQATAHEEELAKFVSVVLADTEDVWDSLFKASGNNYIKPKLVLFNGQIQTACGFSGAATGPFYCPGDQKLYIDLGFLEDLQQKLDAQGDFAQAYIIAHEVGHHVQKLMGTLDKVHEKQGQISEQEYNRLNVKLELQADFLAGVWAHHAQRMKNILEEGDIEEAFRAANAVGDDRIQKQSQGYIVPDSFTHGTSKQRVYWFSLGFKTGDIRQGDTFNKEEL